MAVRKAKPPIQPLFETSEWDFDTLARTQRYAHEIPGL